MKRLMLMAAAMTLGGAAIAQDATTTVPQPVPPAAPDTTMPDPATGAPADAGTMQEMQNDPAVSQPTQTESAQPMPAPMQQPVAQPMSNDGNMATQGSMSNAGMMQPQPATGEYPRCSRTVTDRCTQVGASARRR